MGFVKKIGIFLLPLILLMLYKVIWKNFLIVVLITHSILPRLPLQRYQELTPDLNLVDTPDRLLLKEYDFIVIGGGSAGAVVANRLSENKSWDILLLEAGGEGNIESEIPSLWPANIMSNLNWGYKTQSDRDMKMSTMTENRSPSWHSGKVLGGTSTLNIMLYVRGNKKDYDLWKENGNNGWGYKDVLPYFLKSEDNKKFNLQHNEYHSTGGELTVEDFPVFPILEEMMEACQYVAPFNPDYNGEKQSGCVYFQGTTRKGQRCSTAKAFLRSISDRKNLHISAMSHVHKISIDAKTKEARGILYRKNGKLLHVAAKKEVILSAGPWRHLR